ncbi:MAG: hypothetical protein R3Y07_09595 [Eubacteriales bacterium]
MELFIENGDYVPDGLGGFVTVEQGEEMLQRVLTLLKVPRGSFYPVPTLGSRLHLLGRELPSARQVIATQYVVEALSGESDLVVEQVELSAGNESEMVLEVGLIWKGGSYTLSTTIT